MRWVFRIAGVLVSLVVLLVAAMMLIPTDRIARIALQHVEAATGRALEVHGPVRIALHPMPVVALENVTLANADWAEPGPMLRADAIELRLEMAALLRGEFLFSGVTLQAPELLMERGADGRVNWDLTLPRTQEPGAQGTAPDPAPGRGIALPLVTLNDASVRYRDHASGTDIALSAIEAELDLPGGDRAGQLSGSAVYQGQPVRFILRAAAPAALLDGGRSEASAELDAGTATLRFAGQVGAGAQLAEGQLSVNVPDQAVLRRLAGPGTAALPDALMPLAAQGQLAMAGSGRLDLRDATLRLGANTLTGALALAPGTARPQLTGALQAETLDLTGQAAPDAAPAAQEWSREPMDFAALERVDADISLAAGTLRLQGLTISPARLALQLDAARAAVDLQELGLFDGTLQGEFVVNGRGNGSVGGNLRFADISLQPLMQAAAGIERLEGRASLNLHYLGLGRSMHAIMTSLSGEGRLQAGPGAITGFDLAELLRTLNLSQMDSGERTVFNSVTAGFTIDAGVLRNDNLALEAPLMTLRGRGQLGLGNRTVDYQVTPEVIRPRASGSTEGTEGESLRVPLLIAGPWAAPRVRLDLEALARERLESRRQQIEDRARTEAEALREDLSERASDLVREGLSERASDVVRDALGLQEGTELPTADALREMLRNEGGQGLRGLLGRN